MNYNLNFIPFQEKINDFIGDVDILSTVCMDENKDVTIAGKLRTSKKDISENLKLIYWAANSPNYRQSYSGSALPFPSREIAYENTQNKGIVPINKDGSFSFSFDIPNAYYESLGTVMINPHINLQFSTDSAIGQVHSIVVGEPIPFRTLTYPNSRQSSTFYERYPVCNKARTQNEILQACSYPSTNKQADNFWGKCPSH